jgi:hypothetical protein
MVMAIFFVVFSVGILVMFTALGAWPWQEWKRKYKELKKGC